MYYDIDTEALLYVLGDVPGRLAPYVPTPHYLRRIIARIIADVMRETGIDVVYEPGCGAGDAAESIEEEARPRHYVGLEIDPDLARLAKRRIALGDIVVGDLRNPPLRRRPVVVYAYLLPRPLTHVIREAASDSVVVSLEYEPEEWGRVVEKREERIDTVLTTHRVLILRVG